MDFLEKHRHILKGIETNTLLQQKLVKLNFFAPLLIVAT